MQYNMKLMWVSTLYQFWEQQVRKFLYVEVSKEYSLGNGDRILLKDFCTKGIVEIKSIFSHFNHDLEKMSMWGEINKLRLLTNTIKHGDGGAATQLRKICPSYFHSDYSSIDLLELYKTILNERVLNITDQDFMSFCADLIAFWDELPERMYTN